MNKLVLLTLAIILIVPFTSADLIIPGYKGITINNVIDNIGDYPDYVFIEVGKMGDRLCSVGPTIGNVLERGEVLTPVYKFCSISVYAVPKDKFDVNKLVNLKDKTNNEEKDIAEREFLDYLGSFGKEVLKDIRSYRSVPESNPVEKIDNHYTIDLNKVKTAPDSIDVENNYLAYIYLIISLISLLIIIFILVRRKND